MFTGIIEDIAQIIKIEKTGTNYSFWLTSKMVQELKVDQSISHNGVCLTVEQIVDNQYKVTAIQETLQKTNLKHWKELDKINVERCVAVNARFDGHFVSGHVDTTAICTNIMDKNGSWEFLFQMHKQFASNIIEKGSIAINGISLTIFNIGLDCFTVAIIPYTYEHTNMHTIKQGDEVNIELDMIGKFINRIQEVKNL